jgi:hypothetical protein
VEIRKRSETRSHLTPNRGQGKRWLARTGGELLEGGGLEDTLVRGT